MPKCRVLLVISAVVLIGMIVHSVVRSKHTEYAPLESLTLFVTSDLHYLSPELTDYGAFFQELIRNGDGKAMEYCEEVMDTFVQQVIAKKPDALILSGALTDSTLQWVERQLREAERQGSRVLAVSHQNLLEHNSIFSYGFVMGNGAALLALYEKYNVICNLSGHMHIQHITRSKNGLSEIASSSLLVSPNQYGVLTLNGTSASYDTARVNVSLLTGKDSDSDNDLMDFSEYAHAFLWNTAYRQAEAELDDAPKLEQMCVFFADVNTAYVSGRMDTVTQNETLYQMWRAQNTFIAAYLQSVLDDGFHNYTAYSFSFH